MEPIVVRESAWHRRFIDTFNEDFSTKVYNRNRKSNSCEYAWAFLVAVFGLIYFTTKILAGIFVTIAVFTFLVWFPVAWVVYWSTGYTLEADELTIKRNMGWGAFVCAMYVIIAVYSAIHFSVKYISKKMRRWLNHQEYLAEKQRREQKG